MASKKFDYYKKHEEQKKSSLIAILSLLFLKERFKKRAYTPKRFWPSELMKAREIFGFYNGIFPIVQNIHTEFLNYCRMSLAQYEELLNLVGPLITKQHVVREPVPPSERLLMTLRYKDFYKDFIYYFYILLKNSFYFRYLASGDIMHSLHYQYLRGEPTISKIIPETCQAIWDCLQPKVLPANYSEEQWLEIAKDFKTLWQFDHCIGCVDGKHIRIQVIIII